MSIIDPMWFYWISVIESLETPFFILTALLVVSSIIALGVGIIAHFDAYDDSDREAAGKIRKYAIKYLIIGMILAVILAFIPDKQTLIEMQIAKMATYENAELTVDAIKSTVDYIVEAIKEIK